MENRKKMIIITACVVVAVAAVIWLWHAAHAPKRRIVLHKRAVVKEAAVKKALPAVQKKFARPKIAIVMDDCGYNMNDLDAVFGSGRPVTLAVLPNLPFSKRVAELARSKGYETILHLPLEAIDKKATAESGTIRTDMGKQEIVFILDRDIASVPGIRGVSNHQGSKATEDAATMTAIMDDLKTRKLFFFDSFVNNRSVCRDVATSARVPYARRDFFLDNEQSPDYVEKQLLSLRRFAFRKGSAIAVCHHKKNTITVLNRMMSELSDDGIEFVRLSDMVR
jgi:polysaccharide deacetylase 2 family uncharacterized protein YibQ